MIIFSGNGLLGGVRHYSVTGALLTVSIGSRQAKQGGPAGFGGGGRGASRGFSRESMSISGSKTGGGSGGAACCRGAE